jgi:hypothetical protein
VAWLPGFGCGGEESVDPGPKPFIAAEVQAEIHPGDVAMDEAGRFFVVWGDDREGHTTLWARLYDARGEPITNEFRVSSTELETQYASVRVGPDGRTIVAFSAEDEHGVYDSRIRHFDDHGRPLGEDLVVFRDSVRPDVEILPDGSLVVTDTVGVDEPRDPIDRLRFEVRVRRFHADLRPFGKELNLQANPNEPYLDAADPRVRTTPDGGYTVLWYDRLPLAPYSDYASRYYFDLFSQHFNTFGPTGPLQYLQLDPPPELLWLQTLQNRFVSLADGSMALLATGREGDPRFVEPRLRAYIQLVSPSGRPLGQAFPVHSRTEPADILGQDLALVGCGTPSGCLLMVTWTSVPLNRPDEVTVYGRLFDPTGRPRPNPFSSDGTEFALGQVYSASAYPYIGANLRGDVVLIWRKTGGTGDPQLERIDGVLYRGFAEAVAP